MLAYLCIGVLNCWSSWKFSRKGTGEIQYKNFLCTFQHAALTENSISMVLLLLSSFLLFDSFVHSPKIFLLQINELNYFYNGRIKNSHEQFHFLFKNHCRCNTMKQFMTKAAACWSIRLKTGRRNSDKKGKFFFFFFFF